MKEVWIREVKSFYEGQQVERRNGSHTLVCLPQPLSSLLWAYFLKAPGKSVDRTTCFPSHPQIFKDSHILPKLIFRPCLPTFPFTNGASQQPCSKSLTLILADPVLPGPTQTVFSSRTLSECPHPASSSRTRCCPSLDPYRGWSFLLSHHPWPWDFSSISLGHPEDTNQGVPALEASTGLTQCLVHCRDSVTTYASVASILEGRPMCIAYRFTCVRTTSFRNSRTCSECKVVALAQRKFTFNPGNAWICPWIKTKITKEASLSIMKASGPET